MISHLNHIKFMEGSTNNHSRLEQRLAELSTLKDGWDGELATKPSIEAINQMRSIISSLDEDLLIKASIFPSNDAGVYLQSVLPNGRLTIFSDGKKCTIIVKSPK